MSVAFHQTEGIILQVVPFQDRNQILTVFTHHSGILKLFYKASRSKQGEIQGLWAPLTFVEIIYKEKDCELLPCHEITLIDSNHCLREELIFLDVAASLLKTVRLSQAIGKPAPLVYQLIRYYMSKICKVPDPWALAISFQLKILSHEGLIALPFSCQVCQTPISSDAYTHYSHWLCSSHKSLESTPWTESEILLAYHLANCRHFHEIMIASISPELKNKVSSFFEFALNST